MDVVDAERPLARARRGRRARLPQAVPGDDARLLARPGALPRHVLAPLPGRLGARRLGLVDADGFWFLHGRSDDTLNIAGKRHRPGRARVGRGRAPGGARGGGGRRAARGEGRGRVGLLRARCPAPSRRPSSRPRSARRSRRSSARRSRPSGSLFVAALPKTRSAKIVRRAVRATALGSDPGDLSSLENPEALDAIAEPSPELSGSRSSPAAAAAIGANVARELAEDGVVGRRRRTHARRRSRRSRPRSAGARSSSTSSLARVDRARGGRGRRVELLVNNAGISGPDGARLGGRPRRVVARVRGERPRRRTSAARAVIPGMIERGARPDRQRRARGAAYLPMRPARLERATARARPRCIRFSELLANQLAPHGVPVFSISPGPRPHRDDRGRLRRRRAVDAARARADARPRARDGPRTTRSPAATSTPSTTTSTTCSRGSTRCATTT